MNTLPRRGGRTERILSKHNRDWTPGRVDGPPGLIVGTEVGLPDRRHRRKGQCPGRRRVHRPYERHDLPAGQSRSADERTVTRVLYYPWVTLRSESFVVRVPCRKRWGLCVGQGGYGTRPDSSPVPEEGKST